MPRKLPDLPFVKYVKGGKHAYFNTGRRKPNGALLFLPLPDPASDKFHSTYAAFLAGRNRKVAGAYTVASLADDYEKSAKFGKLADNTKKLYRNQLRKIRQFWGHFAVDSLEPGNVQETIDEIGWAPGTQNMVTATLGALYTWGRKNKKTKGEPTKDLERAKGGSHKPWPDDVLQAGLDAEDPTIRLAVHLLYFTGLRIGDVLKLRWGQIDSGVITVTPEKTARFDKTLYIEVAAELKAELAQTPRVALTVLPPVNSAGLRLTQARLRKDLGAFVETFGISRVPHGLRKNAVNSLLLAGCSIAETAAITGQTYLVVEQYAAQINRKQLASAAIVKLDTARKKTGTGNRIGN